MPKISKILLVSAAATAASVLVGCSTIEHGTYQKITITSSPEKSLCKIYREGRGYMKAVATPGATYIMRDPGAIKVVCSKQGYQTTTVDIAIKEEPKDGSVGNFATLGLGFFIDTINSLPKALPETIHVDLPPQ